MIGIKHLKQYAAACGSDTPFLTSAAVAPILEKSRRIWRADPNPILGSMILRKFLFACILLSGCDRPPGESPPVALEGTVVSDGDFLGEPRRLLAVGDRLLVADDMAPYLHVLDAQSGKLLASTGKEGGGPGEFGMVRELLEAPARDGSFWVYDSGNLRLSRMAFDRERAEPRIIETVRLEAPALTLYMQPVLLDDSTLVASGIFPEGRLVRTRLTGRPVGTIGATPAAPAGRDVPITVLQHAWEGPLERSPDGSRLALATRNGDLIEIFRADGTLFRTLRGGSGFDPAYEVRRSPAGVSMMTGDDLRFGYGDLASTDEHLFALFSGETRGSAPGMAQFGKLVHVFRWDGERVASLQLPERARAITVTPDGADLFAIHVDPKPAVVRYPLREHLPARR
ncbi:MAG TPA: BF3164 family lipoprotein [Longimicrobium sp.]|nr:BF3164 family lipoprotein [Longimicrobium sp.]